MLRNLILFLSATLVVSGEPNSAKIMLAETQFEVGKRLGYSYEVEVLSQEPYRVRVRESAGGGAWKVQSLQFGAGKDPADAFGPSTTGFLTLKRPPVGKTSEYPGGLDGGVAMFSGSGGTEAWIPLSSISSFLDRWGHSVPGFETP